MEGFNHTRPAAEDRSITSSIYSADTMAKPESSHSNDKRLSVHKRQSPSVPSYMNATIIRKPLPSRNDKAATDNKNPSQSPPPILGGVLLVAIADKPHPSTISYLQSMLRKGLYKEINIMGNAENEEQLKQLKVDVYALLGKLGKEMTVQLDLRSSWAEAEISTAMLRVVANGNDVESVLCSPSCDLDGSSELDILAVKPSQLESHWKSSVGFLHSVAKGTIPHFFSNAREHAQPGLFLVTSGATDSSTSMLYNSACRTLMSLLVEANSKKHLTIDYAENVLPPNPPSAEADGNLTMSEVPASDVGNSSAQESPTKLWMNWEEMIEFMPG